MTVVEIWSEGNRFRRDSSFWAGGLPVHSSKLMWSVSRITMRLPSLFRLPFFLFLRTQRFTILASVLHRSLELGIIQARSHHCFPTRLLDSLIEDLIPQMSDLRFQGGDPLFQIPTGHDESLPF